MTSNPQNPPHTHANTQTPPIELVRPTDASPARASPDDAGSSDEDEVLGDEDNSGEAASTSEEHRLLGRNDLPRKSQARNTGWTTVLGSKIPTRLIYLFLAPVAVLGIFIIARTLPTPQLHLSTLSNGTHTFHPTVLLISLDGVRPSYLTSHPDLVPNLLAMANSTHGLRAESMQPRFPTQTFPNHWSLMTGLYPESHGIIANDFWDPQMQQHFVYTKHDSSWDARWWWGEPMWSVAQRGGRISANIMWPGPPVTSHGIAPALFVPYRNIPPSEKLKQMCDWLDMPIHSRPQLITTYIPNVDQMGHKGGPDSKLVKDALQLVDGIIGDVVESLAQRNLSDIVDVIVVSDHGMTSTANERLIFLDETLGEQGYSDIEHRDGWPSVGLRFKEGSPTDAYLDTLKAAADRSNGSFAVYTHATMPERWHFNRTDRIAPILLVPKLGWAITDNHEHKVINKGDYNPKGNHGYDNIEPEMQAIFFAHGPFARALKTASAKRGRAGKRGWVSLGPPVMESFSNLEIFPLVMRLMGLQGIEPAHNGTEGFWDDYLRS